MRWLELARGEELGSDLKCDRPGAMGCGGTFPGWASTRDLHDATTQ